jgi:hypothetical protein
MRMPQGRPVKKAARKPRGLYGWITHTDLASNDPAATKAWCQKVLGWTFTLSLPVPGGAIVRAPGGVPIGFSGP